MGPYKDRAARPRRFRVPGRVGGGKQGGTVRVVCVQRSVHRPVWGVRALGASGGKGMLQ